MITLANFLVIAVVALGISSLIWPARLPVLIPVAVIVLGLIRAMKRITNLFLIATILVVFGCTNVPIQGVSPVSTTGQDLNTLAAQATQAWVDYKAGRVDYAWALSHGLAAYQSITKTSADVKALVKEWTGDGTFAEKLARIFAASTAPPEAKMKALAAGVTISAGNTGP